MRAVRLGYRAALRMQGSATDASAVAETEPQIQAQLQMLGVVSDARWHFVRPDLSKAYTQP